MDGGASRALNEAASALDEHRHGRAAEALYEAAEHLANLEHAFRLRRDTIEQMRQDIETLRGQVLLLTDALRLGGVAAAPPEGT